MCNLITFQKQSQFFYLMEKKGSKYNQKEKPNWDWTHIQCYLKTVESNRKSVIWNLSPSIILTNPSSDEVGPNVRLYIDTQKSLQYSNELGWNWHKSWNIPNISLRLEIKDQNTGDFLLSPRNLYAQIFAVKKNSQNQKSDRMTLIDVGIRGQSKMEMIDGQVYFSAIKFSSTTYNNEGINFNLLIVLYINQGEFEKPKVLTAVISPPIFVDSRRSARDYQQKKFSSFVEPFGYENIEKQFIKRQNKSKCESEVVIKNDPEGFYNYITAPNIRHKVKHPVFLAIKFSNCVKIYYNSKFVEATNMNTLLENLQSKLLKQNKNKLKSQNQISSNLEEKHFLFVVSNLNDSLKRKKVIESIETMQNQFIGIICSEEEIIESFIPLDSIETIKKGYKETYESLINICQNYEPEYPQESEDEYYSQQYEQSQKLQKKVKKEAVEPQKRNRTTIITNKNMQDKQEKQKEKENQAVLKKQELFDSHFEAPAFFTRVNQENDNQNQHQNNRKAGSAFSKAVGFRNVSDNNPIFDTSNLNKAFSNNMASFQYSDNNQNNHQPTSFIPEPIKSNAFKKPSIETPQSRNNESQNVVSSFNQNVGPSNIQNHSNHTSIAHPVVHNNQNFNMQNLQSLNNMPNIGGGFNNSIYENLMYSNTMLSNWLSSVKNNNNSLYQNMNNTITDQIIHKNNLERYMQSDQQQKIMEINRMPLQSQEQQSIICLIQQITLYKELLAQVTYQNQLLSRDMNFKMQNQGLSHSMGMNPMGFSNHEMSQFGNMNSQMNSMNFMNKVGQNMNNMSNLPNKMQNNMQNSINNLSGNLPTNMGSMQSGLGSLQGNMSGNMQNMNSLSNISSMSNLPSSLMANHFPNTAGLGQMNLNNIFMGQGRNIGESSVEKDQMIGSIPRKDMNNSILNPANLPNFGGIGAMSGANYQIIKNLVLEEMKKEAEMKEKQESK